MIGTKVPDTDARSNSYLQIKPTTILSLLQIAIQDSFPYNSKVSVGFSQQYKRTLPGAETTFNYFRSDKFNLIVVTIPENSCFYRWL